MLPEEKYDITVTPCDFDDAMSRYDPVLGIEVHIELSTNSKMFSTASAAFGDAPNTNVTPTCLGLPGALPVVNKQAVENAIKIGLSLHCSIAPVTSFARKNYFYPDQPKNYQISQSDLPIAFDGYLDVPLDDGSVVRVEVERAHMEEDTGKLNHIGSSDGRIHGAEYSLLDFNRAGVPLIEIVTRPIQGMGSRTPEVARCYVQAIRDIAKSLGVSDARMDQGSLRCDANVSLSARGSGAFGTRTETKNMNSLRSIHTAVEYEICRQAAVLDQGKNIALQTRHFHEEGYTASGRIKETADDYRYFPEPDIPPVKISQTLVDELQSTLPVHPWIQLSQRQTEWNLTDEVMRDLVNLGVIDKISETIDFGVSVQAARAWWSSFLPQLAAEKNIPTTDLIRAEDIAQIIKLVEQGRLTKKLAQQTVKYVVDEQKDPEEIIEKYSLSVVRDNDVIDTEIDNAIERNPHIIDVIKAGKTQAVGKLVGEVMKATQGQADASIVKQKLLEKCQNS